MSQAAVVSRGGAAEGRRQSVVGAGALIGAGVLALAVTVAAATFAPGLARHGDRLYAFSGGVMTLSDTLVLAGVVALLGTGAVRPGWLRRVAFFLAIAGSAGVCVAEVMLRVNADAGNTAFQVVGPVQAVGLILVGVGIILTRAWSGWRRFITLVMGLYVPAVLVPAINASGGENLPALAGYHTLILLVGVAFLVESRAEARA
jgi:hypothetical protein